MKKGREEFSGLVYHFDGSFYTVCLYKEWLYKLYAVIKLIYDESTRDKVAELSGPLSQPLCDSIHLSFILSSYKQFKLFRHAY
jgi:hypothetical protein